MAQTAEITENVPSNNWSYVWITFTAASISYHHMNALQYTFKHSRFYTHLMQGKGTVFTVYTIKTYWWIRGTAPLIHSHGTIRRWGVNCMPQLLQTQERTLIPNEKEAGWNPELVWKFWRIEKSLAPAKIHALVRPPCSLVAVPTMLPRPLKKLMRC